MLTVVSFDESYWDDTQQKQVTEQGASWIVASGSFFPPDTTLEGYPLRYTYKDQWQTADLQCAEIGQSGYLSAINVPYFPVDPAVWKTISTADF